MLATRARLPPPAGGRGVSVDGVFQAVRKYVWPEFHELRPMERELFAFRGEADMRRWQTTSDAAVGGRSELTFTQHEDFARFKGTLSTATGGTGLKESGYVAMRTQPPRNKYLMEQFLNLDAFDGLELHVRGDGRVYFLNIQTDSFSPDDLFQSMIYTKAGEWTPLLFPFEDFLLTFHGFIQHDQPLLYKRRVRTIGISLADRKPGPFCLDVRAVRAVSDQYLALKARDAQTPKLREAA